MKIEKGSTVETERVAYNENDRGYWEKLTGTAISEPYFLGGKRVVDIRWKFPDGKKKLVRSFPVKKILKV